MGNGFLLPIADKFKQSSIYFLPRVTRCFFVYFEILSYGKTTNVKEVYMCPQATLLL